MKNHIKVIVIIYIFTSLFFSWLQYEYTKITTLKTIEDVYKYNENIYKAFEHLDYKLFKFFIVESVWQLLTILFIVCIYYISIKLFRRCINNG